METQFDFEMASVDKKFKRKVSGITDLNIEKFEEIEKICFDNGYSIGDFITFFIENLSAESAEQLLATMDSAPRTEE